MTTPEHKNRDAEEELYRLQAEFCKGMAHPKRILVLNLLKDGDKTVNELVEKSRISQANLSQHLSILRRLGLVHARRDGANVRYSIADHRIVEACELVRKTIGERLRKSQTAIEITV